MGSAEGYAKIIALSNGNSLKVKYTRWVPARHSLGPRWDPLFGGSPHKTAPGGSPPRAPPPPWVPVSQARFRGSPHANRCSVVPRGLPAARLPSVALQDELQQSSPAQELASGPRHLECCLKAAALALLWRPDHCRRRACLGVRPMS